VVLGNWRGIQRKSAPNFVSVKIHDRIIKSTIKFTIEAGADQDLQHQEGSVLFIGRWCVEASGCRRPVS
jgi:hypothetical protein